MALDVCSLCGLKKPLRKSHIVPRFVAKWLKSTSATGFLEDGHEPGQRLQDALSFRLLCEECEQRFSRLESYFARQIFFPFLEGSRDIQYDERLLRFIVSLNWRILKLNLLDQNQSEFTPWIKEQLEKADHFWRNFLLTESSDFGSFEHHMYFVDYVKEAKGMPRKFQWYTMLAIDATLVSYKDIVYAYTHFPKVVFVSSICPEHLLNWEGTKIETEGKINFGYKVQDRRFLNFLLERSNTAMGSSLNWTKKKRILQAIVKNPERFFMSESFTTAINESRRERKERKKALPENIRQLIDIVETSLIDPQISKLEQNMLIRDLNLIASELSDLPLEQAEEISSLMWATKKGASIIREQMYCSFQTDDIFGRFLVCFCETKNEQRELAKKYLDCLIKEYHNSIFYNAKFGKFVIVFSFNPLDSIHPYETAYYIGDYYSK